MLNALVKSTAETAVEAALPVAKDSVILVAKCLAGCALVGLLLPVGARVMVLGAVITESAIQGIAAGASATTDFVGSVPRRVTSLFIADESVAQLGTQSLGPDAAAIH